MNLYCRIFFFWMLFFLHDQVSAQFGTTPQIINFPKTEYNASNQNWSIDQDEAGNLFVANNKGLLVYNGAWQLYELPGQQIVRSVLCSKDGNIYTGGFGEFGYWKKEYLGNYSYHSLTKNIDYKQFSKEEIWKITQAGDNIYFQSFSTIYVLENGKINAIPCPGNIMYAFWIHGKIYVQVLQKGIYVLKGRTFEMISNLPVFQKDEIITMLENGKDNIIIGTVHNGLFELKKDVAGNFTSDINNVLKNAQLNASARLSDSTFAIGTIPKGVYIVKNDGHILEHFDQQNGLQNNTVLSLKKDMAGNLWVGMDRGLDELVLQSPLRYFQDVNGNLGSVYTAAIYNGNFYIGCNDGLYRYDVQNGYKNVGDINWQVWSLNLLNGQLFCAHNSGITIIDQNGISSIPNMPGGWALKKLQSNSDFALQGTYIGLSVYKKGEDGYFHYKKNVSGLETMPLSDWIEDKNGDIWLKHAYRGISKIKLNKDCDSVLQEQILTSKNGVDMDIQQNIAYWDDHVYTISTEGIKIWREGQARFEKVDDLLGFVNASQKVKRIFSLPNHSFWVVKDDNQLTYIENKGNHFPFSLKDFSLVGGYENILVLDSANIILCGENGFALFNPSLLSHIHSNPPTISSVFINEKSDFRSVSRLAKAYNGHWEIPYQNRSIKVVAANNVFDRLVQYRFKLTKIGEPAYWSEWQNSTAKVYNNLPTGDYRIEVQTNINTNAAYFEFTILAPWYWSWWSKLLYVVFFLMTIWFVFEKMEQKHQKTIRLKQVEMEKKLSMQKMQHEHEVLLLKKEKLEKEVQWKSEDLANSANELIKRKKLLNRLHVEIGKQHEGKEKANNLTTSMKKLTKELERQIKLDKEETKLFEHGFNTVHEQFLGKLLNQYSNLTPQDLKLAAYLRMNLGSKEIAPLLNITVRGVELKRYRLRKKMNLEETVNLNEFMMKFS